MSAPVDVLAVLDRYNDGALAAYNKAAANALTDDEIAEAVLLNEQLAQGLAASAAIAELIEADKEYDAAEVAWHALAPSGVGELDARTEDCAEYLRFQRAISRRAAALRACGGA